MVGLAPQLVEAFAVPHVRVDAACLTAETLMLALGEPVRLIHEGKLRPESIDVRILLPSRDINLAFPVSVDAQGDQDPVHQRWLEMRNAQGHVLRHNLRALRSSHGIDVNVTFRALPFTPPVKLYLLNGVEALIAYYMITRREEEVYDRAHSTCTTPWAPHPSCSPSSKGQANATPPSSSSPKSGSTPSGKPSRRT